MEGVGFRQKLGFLAAGVFLFMGLFVQKDDGDD